MSDWQVGDLAVCVDAAPWGNATNPTHLVKGRVYRVLGKSRGRFDDPLLVIGPPDFDAFLDGHPGQIRFRKIRPDAQEACEPEFVTLLKRTKVTA